MVKYAYTDGKKAATLSDVDGFLDWLVSDGGEADGTIRQSVAMQKVAFVYRCVRLIADAVRAAPFRIAPVGGDDAFDESLHYANNLGFMPTPKRTMELVARSLLGPGSAYLYKVPGGKPQVRVNVVNGQASAKVTGGVGDLKYFVASTIEPQIDGRDGLTGFRRTAGKLTTEYKPEELVYFWPADETVEIGPPKSSPVTAALMAAGADYYTSKFIADFFARGAIKGTLLAVKGNPTEPERKRLKDWFRATFFGGSRTAFNTEIINADAIEPVKIGEGLEGLNNSELSKQMREDIVVAMGVPISKILSSSISGLGGGNVASQDDIAFYQDTVKPLGDFMADTINQQLLAAMGYEWRWLWDSLDVFQADEHQRSIAFKTYVDAGMKQAVAASMLGIEIPKPDDIPEWYEDAFEDKPDPMAIAAQFAPRAPGQPGDDDEDAEPETSKEQAAEVAKERAKIQPKSTDLDKWERFAIRRFDEGHPEKALTFAPEALAPTLAASIRGALEECRTTEDVRAMFEGVRAWEGYP